MELDDLKGAWAQSNNVNQSPLTKADLTNKLSLIKKSRQWIAVAFWLEAAFGLIIYIVVLITICLFKNSIYPFIYKFLVVISIMCIPVFIRLYKSVKWMNKMDFSKDVCQTIGGFVRYFKTTLKIYRLVSYAALLVILIIFLTDASFLALDFGIKGLLIVYLFILAALVNPYLKWAYGNKIRSFEHFILVFEKE